jgi:site-specific recombinase XerD
MTVRTMPTRLHNSAYRSREFLTPAEVDAMMKAAHSFRWGHRDTTMLLVCYRHGFSASELVDLRWSQVGLVQARIHIKRVKRGTPSVHPLQEDEVASLRRLRLENPHSEFVFMTERGGPFSVKGFASLVKRCGARAGLPFKAHAQMLRHACGHKLAGDGHDARVLQHFFGHKEPCHTGKYFDPLPVATAFDGLWK